MPGYFCFPVVETWFHRIMSVNKSTCSPEAQRTRSCPGPSLWGEQDWLVPLRLRTSKYRDIKCHYASLITQHERSIPGHRDGTYFGMLLYSIDFNFSYGHHRNLWQLLKLMFCKPYMDIKHVWVRLIYKRNFNTYFKPQLKPSV